MEPLRSDASGAVKMLWVVMQPGAVTAEGGLRVPVRVEVPAVLADAPPSFQARHIDMTPFLARQHRPWASASATMPHRPQT